MFQIYDAWYDMYVTNERNKATYRGQVHHMFIGHWHVATVFWKVMSLRWAPQEASGMEHLSREQGGYVRYVYVCLYPTWKGKLENHLQTRESWWENLWKTHWRIDRWASDVLGNNHNH